MVEALIARSPLIEVLPPGRHGHAEGAAGVRAMERIVGGAVSLAARDAGVEALAAALRWPLPTTPRCVVVEGHWVIWTGPGRWLVFSDTDIEADLRARARAGAFGSVADQSDSRIVIRLQGARVRDALAKGVSIDLHPRAFAIGDAAPTLAAHIAILLWREDEDGFGVAVPRGFAGSFAEWLGESSLEYGFQIG